MEPLSRITDATVDVLQALLDSPGPVWGLALVKASGRPAGSVYPILERLERAGWLESEWEQDASRPGPRRRYYTLSEGGAAAARQAIAVRATRSSTAAAAATATTAPAVAGGLA
ncbi:PadR family transcriptional regulator [Agromyces cerinus]|uniref:Transcriptional regulator PadR-like family protein n=1 Tax=Agromyces cerinus subsp. cerinus TaxID=232089 RepID=A0A1N6HR40_9MICO|nr:helix-turn-helix transcriptional regulator [Agromyces cerinus]SIO22242.1 Transcriptional regulator PadR-like family protein [Agromyces cerinus subsp. cerinus]